MYTPHSEISVNVIPPIVHIIIYEHTFHNMQVLLHTISYVSQIGVVL